MTIDVAANSADEARAAVIPTIAAALGGTVVTQTTTTTAAVLPTSSSSVVAPSTNPAQALATAAVLNPDRSLGYLERAGYGTGGALAP
jgi:hypothetical protein